VQDSSTWAESVVADDLVATKSFHPHDLFTGLDVELGFHGQDHHGVVAHVHGVHFVAFEMGHHGRALFDHGNVDAVGHGADVGDFLVAEDVDEFKASLGRAVLTGLRFRDAQDFVSLVLNNTESSTFERTDFNTVGAWQNSPSPSPYGLGL